MSASLFIEGKMSPLTNQGCAFRVDDSTREEVEVILLAVHHHRVSGIIPTLQVQSGDIWRLDHNIVRCNTNKMRLR